MLALIVTDRLYRTARRSLDPSGPGVAAPATPSRISPLDPATVGAPRGTRYQLLRALRAMADGEAMVVEHRIPSLSGHFDDASRRERWFRSLQQIASWEDESKVEPLLVPGTAFPRVIGRILIHAGWCAPSEQPHWVPNLRFFFLTDDGFSSYKQAQAWWLGLPPLQRMRLILAE